ncbi:restriction endonuclease subunit S [Variovorax sp. 160MFSha2.1]|uniref:restriction endonuclease subunit S n=1 Tax=Variovorax sp. 160MFSha2.1 TaxID=3158367 RepID=UPI003AAC2203
MSDVGLPRGWVQCRLGDVIAYGSTDKFEPDEIAPDAWILELEDIEKDTSRLLHRKLFSERQSKSTKNQFRKGDVLYGKLRPYLCKVLKAEQDGYCTTEILPLRPPKEVDAGYLFHWLKHPTFLNYVNAMSHGMNMPRLGTDAGKAAPFVLAPLSEQKRIAGKLDALLSRLDASRRHLDRVPTLLRRFREALFSAAVRGVLTSDWRSEDDPQLAGTRPISGRPAKTIAETTPQKSQLTEWLDELPTSWKVLPASDVVRQGADIVYGIVQPGPKLQSGVPYIRGMDIVDGKILVDQLLHTSPEIAQRYGRSALQGGDVLLGIIRATKVAIVPESLTGANITQGTARFRPSDLICTEFLAIALEAPETQRWLHAHYRGIDMPGLNLADVRRVPIPLPAPEEQVEIVRRVESLVELADTIEAKYHAIRARIDGLQPVLLTRAFRGELVPQDPDDEPAADLLERIALSRQSTPVARGRTKSQGRSELRPKAKSLADTIAAMSSDDFTFDELRQAASGDYESIKDELFAALADTNSGVAQFFDAGSGSMKIRRVSE